MWNGLSEFVIHVLIALGVIHALSFLGIMVAFVTSTLRENWEERRKIEKLYREIERLNRWIERDEW